MGTIFSRVCRSNSKKIVDVNDDNDGEHALWIEPNSFNVVGMLDCVSKQISRPRSSPDADDPTSRRANAYVKQRTFCDGYDKQHGLSFVTLCIPNGLTATSFGPVSRCHNDRKILQFSEIDDFINALNHEQGHGPHRGLTPPEVEIENNLMKRAQVRIEWGHGLAD